MYIDLLSKLFAPAAPLGSSVFTFARVGRLPGRRLVTPPRGERSASLTTCGRFAQEKPFTQVGSWLRGKPQLRDLIGDIMQKDEDPNVVLIAKAVLDARDG